MSEVNGAEWTLSTEKRMFDLLGITALMPVVLPAAAAAAVVIKGVDGMDPLFVQSRLGIDFEPFDIYKLRTMPVNTPETPSLGSSNDPRATWLGKKLRKAHLDELPQAINVYNGSFSLVGLRALIRQDVEDTLKVLTPSEQESWRQARRTAKPAVFGPFQLEQHVSDYDKEEINYRRAMSDIEYANTASFKGDLGILKQTALEGLGVNGLFGHRDSVERKRGQRGADMLKKVAEGLGVFVSDEQVENWRLTLLAARTVDDVVDSSNLTDSKPLVSRLLAGQPIGDMSYLEAKEFSEMFAKQPPLRSSQLAESFLILPSLLAGKRNASTVSELLDINKAEAAIFSGILELSPAPDNASVSQFNDWLRKFTVAGYTADTFLDMSKDLESGNISLSPGRWARARLGARAVREVAALIKITPAIAYAPIIASSTRTLAK